MAQVVLIEAAPWDPATGQAVAVRLAGGGRRHYTHKGYADWLGGVVSLPKVTTEIGFGQSGFSGGAIPQAAAIGFSPSRRSYGAALARLVWSGAPIRVSVGDDEAAAADWTVTLLGTVAGYAVSAGAFTFTMSDMVGALAKPLAEDTFAGTGGIEGSVEATGRVKRRTWGQAFNVEGRVLDPANAIYEFGDPARPLLGFAAVKDRGRAGPMQTIGWAGSADATLDALKAAAAPQGGAAVAPSIACVKWWTSQPGPAPLTADLLGEVGVGYVETVGGIAARIVAAVGVPALADVAAVIAMRPEAAGLHVDEGGESAAAALDRLLLGASLTWSVDPAGAVRVSPIAFDPVPDVVLRANAIDREAVFLPVKRVEVGYRRNHRLHTDAEISAAVLSDAIVMPDGTGIGAAIAGAGDTAVWSGISGTGKPADNADVTAANVASGFYGQGALATQNQLAYGSPYLTGFNALAALAKVTLGGGYIFRADGTTALTDALAVTALGTAAGISGQGAFATLSSAAYGSSLLTGFGALAPLASIAFGSGYLKTAGGANATDAAYQTLLGTAAAITGQGALATQSNVAWGNQVAGRPAAISNLDGAGRVDSYYVGYGGGTNSTPLSERWPAEFGSNVTENRTAAAITGQGYFATQSYADWTTRITGAGKPTTYLVGARGNATAYNYMPGYSPGLCRGDGSVVDNRYARSYVVVWLESDGIWRSRAFDVYGNGQVDYGYGIGDASGAVGMAMLLNALPSGATVVVYSSDEPRQNRTSGGLPAAMYRCGASRTVFGASWYSHGAYVLVGVAGAGEGNGAEVYEDGGQDASPRSMVNLSFVVVNGRPQINGKTIRSAYDLQFRDGVRVGDRQPQEAGANVTESRTAAAIAGQTAFATLPAGTSLDSSVFGMPSRLGSYDGFLSAGNVQYRGGPAIVSVDSLRPGEAGANVTEARTAAAISGQGAFATLSAAAWGSQITGRPAALTDMPGNAIQANYIVASGTDPRSLLTYFPATGGADKTGNATAAAVTGQGPFATASGGQSLDNTGLFGMPGRLQAHPDHGANYLNAQVIAFDQAKGGNVIGNLRPQEAGANVTEARTAAAISGQGTLATQSNVAWGNQVAGRPAAISNLDGAGRVDSYYVGYGGGTNSTPLSDRWPAEFGSNVTENRTAAAIAGQSYLATNYPERLFPIANGDVRFLRAENMIYAESGYSVANLMPGEKGANVTEARTAAAITGQGWGATASEAAASNARAQIGGNALIDTEFARGRTFWNRFWGGSTGAGFEQGVNLPGWHGAYRNVLWAHLYGSPTGGDAEEMAASWVDPQGMLPVSAGDRVFAAARVAAHRCQGVINIHFYDAGGTYVSETVVAVGGRDGGAANGDPGAFDRIGGFAIVPANAAMANLRVRFRLNGNNDPYLFMMEPQLCRVPAGQTEWPTYVPGRQDPVADKTGDNTAGAIAGQGPFATQAGGVSLDNASLFGMPSRLQQNPDFPGYLTAEAIAFRANSGGNTIQNLRPQEAGANVTEARAAAAITGQGKFATAGQIGSWNVAQYFAFSAFSLNYSITRADGTSIVTESLAITQLGVAAGFAGQGSLATKNQAGAGDLAPSAVQQITYEVLQNTITCPVGN